MAALNDPSLLITRNSIDLLQQSLNACFWFSKRIPIQLVKCDSKACIQLQKYQSVRVYHQECYFQHC